MRANWRNKFPAKTVHFRREAARCRGGKGGGEVRIIGGGSQHAHRCEPLVIKGVGVKMRASWWRACARIRS